MTPHNHNPSAPQSFGRNTCFVVLCCGCLHSCVRAFVRSCVRMCVRACFACLQVLRRFQGLCRRLLSDNDVSVEEVSARSFMLLTTHTPRAHLSETLLCPQTLALCARLEDIRMVTLHSTASEVRCEEQQQQCYSHPRASTDVCVCASYEPHRAAIPYHSSHHCTR